MDIRYRFNFEDKNSVFDLHINEETLIMQPEEKEGSLPDWTELSHNKCQNCPLNEKYCPLAVRLVPLVKQFDHVISHQPVNLTVSTPERTVSKHTTAQEGLSSLMGLIFATSGCPLTGFLKPMARFHLPLANEKETIYRVTSMFMLWQYFSQSDHGQIPMNFNKLNDHYDELQEINHQMAKRVRESTRGDSAVNAIVLLDMLGKSLPFAIEDQLEQIRPYFNNY